MNRLDWLKKMRGEAEEKYDTLWAPLYGEKYGLYSNETHVQFIQKFLSLLPLYSLILDAACGAGRYTSMLLNGGHQVIGVDQSQGMLSKLKAKFPDIRVEKVGLQEIQYDEMFDGAICMDAMEHVCPEDWPLVLGNFHRAIKSNGYLYFTVEIADEDEIKAAFQQGQQSKLPIIYGEMPEENVYHYYPSASQVKEWIGGASFDLTEAGDGDGYHHIILRKTSID